MGRKAEQLTVNDIYSFIGDNQYVYFATTLDNQPKIRPMVLFYIRGRFFFVTFKSDAKIAQVRSNKLCEVLLPLKDEIDNNGYIRMTGTAKICDDVDMKQDAEYFCYFFDQYFDGADDPDFCLIELFFDSFEYMKPGDNHKVIIKN
jgi:general stress protein 26